MRPKGLEKHFQDSLGLAGGEGTITKEEPHED